MLECAKLMLGEASYRKFSERPLSNDTVKSRIEDLSSDKATSCATTQDLCNVFAIQLDESTDVADLSQLYGFRLLY